MIVSEEVVANLAACSPDEVRIFVAGCAERLAQIFTGLRGSDPDRSHDVDTFVGILAELWDIGASIEDIDSKVADLEGFPELRPTETGLQDVASIYAFYAVLVLRYALLGGGHGLPENAVQCAHAILTATGQLQQNVPGSDFMEKEHQAQLWSLTDRDSLENRVVRVRSESSSIGRELLAVIKARIV